MTSQRPLTTTHCGHRPSTADLGASRMGDGGKREAGSGLSHSPSQRPAGTLINLKYAVIGLVACAAIYLAAMCVLAVKQRSLIYPGAHNATAANETFEGFNEVALLTGDGLRLRAVHKPARAGMPSLIFFHGNGDNLRGAIAATGSLATSGYGVLLSEYRGYGGNPGTLTENGLYRDGEAALRWLGDRGVPPGKIVLIGNSLGSGVATELAARHTVGGLVLISGFSSLVDVAAAHIRIFPVRLLLKDRYENATKLPRVAGKVLVLHGSDDTLIPPHHGTTLARAAKRSSLEMVPGAGHELAYLPQSQTIVLQWLNDELRR